MFLCGGFAQHVQLAVATVWGCLGDGDSLRNTHKTCLGFSLTAGADTRTRSTGLGPRGVLTEQPCKLRPAGNGASATPPAPRLSRSLSVCGSAVCLSHCLKSQSSLTPSRRPAVQPPAYGSGCPGAEPHFPLPWGFATSLPGHRELARQCPGPAAWQRASAGGRHSHGCCAAHCLVSSATKVCAKGGFRRIQSKGSSLRIRNCLMAVFFASQQP